MNMFPSFVVLAKQPPTKEATEHHGRFSPLFLQVGESFIRDGRCTLDDFKSLGRGNNGISTYLKVFIIHVYPFAGIRLL